MAEWQETTADIFCTSVRDGTHDSPKPTSRGQKLITSRHIVGGRIDLESAYLISDADYEAINRRSRVDQWDVLITMIGTVGEPCLVRSPPDFAIKNIGLFKSKGELEGKWLYYYLRDNSTQQFIRELSAGTTQSYIALGTLRNLKIRSPQNRREMEAIVSVLGTLDDKIELNRRMNKTLEAMARAIFKDWFVDFGPTRAKMEGRAPYLAPEIWSLFPDRLDGERKPVGWVSEPLLAHARLISGGTPKTEEPAYWGGTISWASAKDVSQCADSFLVSTERTITERGLNESSTRLIPAFSTAVVARGATTGRFCIFGKEMAMNQTCYALHSEKGLHFWLNCTFKSLVEGIVHAAHGSVFDTITTKTIEGAACLIASGDLMNTFEATVSPLFTRILANIEESRTLATIRDLLLPKLMSGEIRVRDAENIVGETT